MKLSDRIVIYYLLVALCIISYFLCLVKIFFNIYSFFNLYLLRLLKRNVILWAQKYIFVRQLKNSKFFTFVKKNKKVVVFH